MAVGPLSIAPSACQIGSRNVSPMTTPGDARRDANAIARKHNVEVAKVETIKVGNRTHVEVMFCGGAADAARAAREF